MRNPSAIGGEEVRFGQRLTTRGRLVRAAFTSGPAVLWLTVLLLLPLLGIVVISFLSRGDDGGFTRPLTVENYQRLAGFGILGFDPLYPVILGRSLALGLGTALACVIASLPLSFFIASLPARWKNFALTMVVIPFWTNLLIRTYAWQIILAPESPFTAAARALGLIAPEAALYPGLFAVTVGMVCDFLPFMVLPLYASVEKLDWTLAEAAADLGANRTQVFRHALLPQIKPGLTAGIILVLLPATGQFVIPDLLGGARTAMLGNIIRQQFEQSRDWPFGASLAVAALALVLTGLWIHARRAANGAGGALA